MQEIIVFVSTAIAGGVVGNTTYDGLKVILGSSFNMLSSYLSTNQEVKFEGALEMLLEDESVAEQIKSLMDGKEINKSFIDVKKSKLDIDLGQGGKATDSFKKIYDSTIKTR
jgi:hypothetical protein